MNEETTISPSRPAGRRKRLIAAATALGIASTTLLAATPASASPIAPPVTARVSVSTSGEQIAAPNKAEDRVLLDSTGRYVFFSTYAALQGDDTNTGYDVYMRDRVAGTTTRVSVKADGGQIANGTSKLCGISHDGRFVGFESNGADLPGNAAGTHQIFVRDRITGTTEMVSVSSTEAPSTTGTDSGITYVDPCPVSLNGRYVAFTSAGTNFTAAENNAWADVFRRDRTAGVTDRISVAGILKANAASRFASMSDDGSKVAFSSDATNLVGDDTNAKRDVFVRTPATQTTIRASVSDTETQSVGFDANGAAISGNGQVVVFTSAAADLVADDQGTTQDVFVRDLSSSSTELVSVATNETQAAGYNASPSVSSSGRFVVFNSAAKNLYVGDTNDNLDTYRRDRQDGTTQLASRTSGILAGNSDSVDAPVVSDDGSTVAFASLASDLVRNDTNGKVDAFVHEFTVPMTPFGSIDALVTQQFADFEGRQPTPGELTEWKARIVNGELSPDNAIDVLAHGTTWAGKRAPLTRLYWAFFLRTPDLGGMDYWVGRLTAGKTLASVAKQFATSSEFQTKYGSKTNSQFVTLIYQNIFDRNPDAGGLAFWTQKLDTQAKTRGDVMVNFSESSEGKRVLAPQTDTTLVVLGMLRSMPSKAFLDLMINGKGAWIPETLIASLRTSPGYSGRITP